MVQLLVHHKWFIRAGLAIFWATEIIAYAFNRGFMTYLLEHHTWWSLIILFLTFKYLLEPFYRPFVTLKTQGGDAIMERSTKIMLVVVAVLGSLLTIVIVSPGARETIINAFNNSFLKPLMGLWLGFVAWIDGFRGIYLLASGLVGGLVLAIFLNQIALPKIRRTAATPKKPYMGEPDYVPGTVLSKSEEALVSEAKTLETPAEKEASG